MNTRNYGKSRFFRGKKKFDLKKFGLKNMTNVFYKNIALGQKPLKPFRSR